MTRQRYFDDRAALQAALLIELQQCIQSALEARGEAVLALSGGTTPIPLYAALASSQLDWKRVQFALVDERWVDLTHEASNEAAIRQALQPALERGAQLLGMKNTAASAQEGQADCAAAYQWLPRPFDVVLLGMGEDGHTASWFPSAEGLAEALREDAPCCVAVTARESPVTGQYTERMTLSLPAVLNTRRLWLLVTGESKRGVLNVAADGESVEEIPVRAILKQTTVPLDIWWAP